MKIERSALRAMAGRPARAGRRAAVLVPLVGLLLISCEGRLGQEDSRDDGTVPDDGDGDGECVPNCSGRECGEDGCGGVCGSCAAGIACNPVLGTCAVLCDNGRLDVGETCDPPGSCPLTCPDSDGIACTRETLIGTAESCSAACVSSPVTTCTPDDGCCPTGCNAADDNDCNPVCGNGVFEPGEVCGDGGPVCPTTCDDEDLCTTDELLGTAGTCDAHCSHVVIDPCALDQARGVTVGNITADQGLRIVIRENEDLVPLQSRNGPLIVERPMLVRASWVIEDEQDFTPRPIRAVLTLSYADFTTDSVEITKQTVTSPSSAYNSGDAYEFVLSAAQVKKGMRIAIELFEVDDSFRNQPPPPTPSRFPAVEGSTFNLGVDTDPSQIDVVLVPLFHNLGGSCPAAPDLNSMTTRGGSPMPEHEYYRQRLLAQNPASNATVTVHEVVEHTGTTETYPQLFTLLRQVREADDAEPWEFYYGVINPCDEGPDFSGIANVPNHGSDNLPDIGDANQRTGWGEYRDDGRHAGTFVHEIGHEQGRDHVGCGNPEDPDPNYPNSTGNIDEWGWDIFSGDRRPPTHKDYMSYCNPTWISQYGYNLMEPWIAEVTSWKTQQAFSRAAPTRMLYATIEPGKADSWWTGLVKHKVSLDPSPHTVHFYSGSTLLSTAVAAYEEVPRSPGSYFLSIILPQDFSKVTHLVHNDGLSLTSIDKADVLTVR